MTLYLKTRWLYCVRQVLEMCLTVCVVYRDVNMCIRVLDCLLRDLE